MSDPPAPWDPDRPLGLGDPLVVGHRLEHPPVRHLARGPVRVGQLVAGRVGDLLDQLLHKHLAIKGRGRNSYYSLLILSDL